MVFTRGKASGGNALPWEIKLIDYFLQSFTRSSRSEQRGFARVAQKVLLRPDVERRLRWNLRQPGTMVRSGLLPKILAFRAAISYLGKSIYPSEVMTKEIVKDHINADNVTVQRLDPKQLYPETLNYLMQAEQVHRMLHREEIISRLVGNRIGYGLFHPLTGPNPLAVLYVALTDGLPQTIQSVWDGSKSKVRENPSHAIFYSISLCQPGARGLGLGNRLIRGALCMLTREFPTVHNFQTLSPIRGFSRWLEERDDIATKGADGKEEELVVLCEEFLQEAYRGKRRVTDPVAVFHYGNGAILAAVLPDADPLYHHAFKITYIM